ncbi:hypothetical protein PR048_029572 [Dryococelus australis]|uniref:Uncharacterized protein n=1 Tax=Dryococelus australis TaxID=614101 RepID=A0ABQ9GDS5_9NEOP|nr:hypothetical protein PR048_029572 [Dryococelus australis]
MHARRGLVVRALMNVLRPLQVWRKGIVNHLSLLLPSAFASWKVQRLLRTRRGEAVASLASQGLNIISLKGCLSILVTTAGGVDIPYFLGETLDTGIAGVDWVLPSSGKLRPHDKTPLDYFLWGHMKSLIYETPVDSEKDLLARIMVAANLGLPGIGDRVYQNMVQWNVMEGVLWMEVVWNAAEWFGQLFNSNVMRDDEVETRWMWNSARMQARRGTGDARESLSTNCKVQHDSHISPLRSVREDSELQSLFRVLDQYPGCDGVIVTRHRLRNRHVPSLSVIFLTHQQLPPIRRGEYGAAPECKGSGPVARVIPSGSVARALQRPKEIWLKEARIRTGKKEMNGWERKMRSDDWSELHRRRGSITAHPTFSVGSIECLVEVYVLVYRHCCAVGGNRSHKSSFTVDLYTHMLQLKQVQSHILVFVLYNAGIA